MSLSFDRACSRVETALASTARHAILDSLSQSASYREALLRLRESMRTNVFEYGSYTIDLSKILETYDDRTRSEGFHVLHDWDGKADSVAPDIIPVDVLNFVIEWRGRGPVNRAALGILLDYYFLHVLALLSVRVWDDGRGDENLDAVERLLNHLQGTNGSGQGFVANAATLILVATSHFEPDERAFDPLLEKARTLGPRHRFNLALVHAVSMGCHLRFGFEATYGRDTVVMRNDNVVDYPWLCFALVTLMTEYARLLDERIHGAEREAVVEAILNALSPDARAFVGEPPASLSAHEGDRLRFCHLFQQHRQALLDELSRYRPVQEAYSPLSFFFNFSHNVLKGTVVDALLRGKPWRLSLNDLLTSVIRADAGDEPPAKLATTLMAYARANPDRIRGRMMPVIVYDPQAGHQAFTSAMKKLTQ
ncbi:MAG TPA: hypothetical protein VNZ26_13550 [Vicinamibacterales bacterium]|nr:hypothetical protein [Vicinamibacterales bacterium]